jgi:hypothetical protein
LFNELSTNSNANHLGWRIECGSVKQDFESEPDKNHFSSDFWTEDFNMIFVFQYRIQYPHIAFNMAAI